MGYFNFLYKLTRIFSNKKMLKTFFIILLIGILYFVLIKPTYASSPYTETYSDPYVAFTENYGQIQRDFIIRLNRAYAQGTISRTNFENVIDYLTSGEYLAYFMYGTSSSSYNNASPNFFTTISLYLMPINNLNITQQNSDWFGITSISQYSITPVSNSLPCYRVRFTESSFSISDIGSGSSWTLYAPYLYLGYMDPYVSEYISMIFTNDNINEILVQLLSQTTSINNYSQQISSSSSSTAQSTSDIKDFLSNPNADDSSFTRTPIQAPSDNVSANVDSIFYMFQDAFRRSVVVVVFQLI